MIFFLFFFLCLWFFFLQPHQGRGSGRQRVKLPWVGSAESSSSSSSSPLACSQWSAARNNLQFSSHLYNYIEIYTENIYKIEILQGRGNQGAKPVTGPRELQPLRWILSLPSPLWALLLVLLLLLLLLFPLSLSPLPSPLSSPLPPSPPLLSHVWLF